MFLVLPFTLLGHTPIACAWERDTTDPYPHSGHPNGAVVAGKRGYRSAAAVSPMVIQVGAYRNLRGAQAEHARLIRHVPGSKIVQSVYRGQSMYRVVTHELSSPAAARALQTRLGTRGFDTYLTGGRRRSSKSARGVYGDANVPHTSAQAKPEESGAGRRSTDKNSSDAGRAAENAPAADTEGASETADADVPKATSATERGKELGREADEKRPEDQFTYQFLGRPLTVGGEYSAEVKFRSDHSLNTREDDVAQLDQELEIELLYPWRDDVVVFLEGKLVFDNDLYAEDGDRDSEGEVQRGQSWLYLDKLFDSRFSLQAGRQSIRDRRSWWWDRKLDAVRLFYDGTPISFQLAAAERLIPEELGTDIDPEIEDVFRVLGRITWRWAKKQRLVLFYAHQNDHSNVPREANLISESREDESDADLNWLGLRATGRWKIKPYGRFDYWLDAAAVRGDETVIDFDDAGDGLSVVDEIEEFKVRGWGLDVGITRRADSSIPYNVTLAYARGSGDRDLDDRVDRSFRQTGLQNNDAKFRGVNRFRYYGELLRPELSNMQVFTVGLGRRFWKRSSIELVYHYYRQVEPAPFLRASRLRTRPLGEKKGIGQELDVVIGLEEWKHWELELVGAVFRAGSAFGPQSGEWATAVLFELEYNF